MLKRYIILLTIILSFCKSYTQQPEKILSRWSEQNPIEKIYLHFDRNDYLAGQTIWFKAYLYSDFLPDDKSTTLYIELINSSSVIISRRLLPVVGGYTRGQIELSDTLPGGSYILRAYTASMLNHDSVFLYKKNFFIFNNDKKANTVIAPQQKIIRMEFFPEGGNLIAGLSNTTAYKASDENGMPVAVSGVIKKENGEKVTEFSSYHNGMGYFDLTVQEKTNYYAVFNDDPSGQKYYLPAQTVKGVVLRIISNGKTKTYEILQRNDDPVFKASYMIGQMQHHVVFRKEFNGGKDEMTGMIQTTNLSSGILHITVFNKNGLPLAERLTFVDNKEYILPGDISSDTLNFSGRAKNRFTLSLMDTVKGSFSVSVTDPAYDINAIRQENIFSGLLLTSDLKGYIHDPAWYFSADNDSIQNALDLVMMTNGWRRFKWNDVFEDALPSKKFSDTAYITLSGKINIEGTDKPFADKELLAIIVSADEDKNIQLLRTDAEGHFAVDSLVFFENARILFSDIKGKKSKSIEVKLDADSLNKLYILPGINGKDFFSFDTSSQAIRKKMLDEYNAILKAQGVMLDGVTVTGHKKTKQEEFEEKYVSGLFSGDAVRKMNFLEEDLTPYQNIFDYLQGRVPGLQIIQDGPDYNVFFRQQTTASSLGNIPVALYLDEILTETNVIASVPANQVALVKIFSTFVGASGNGPGGVVAIFTKRGSDLLNAIPSAGDILNYKGYSVIKEFYSPDYSVKPAGKKTDYRMTLYWNPTVFVNGINPKIPFRFYNNDRTRQFKIVVEGMTVDGKMLMIEKIISPKKAF